MERHGSGRREEPLPSNSIQSSVTSSLKKFTIPRKKRASGQALLESCPEESRDYSLIQSKLKESRLDLGKELSTGWVCRDVKLVHNDKLVREFSEKRSEMRTKGRHGREMEERFCFIVASHQATDQIYQHGLMVNSTGQHSLGKPSHGVYVFRHVDVALRNPCNNTFAEKNLIVFKVLFGKVKKVTPSLEWNRTQDPTVSFDCHISKETVSARDSLSQQVLGSYVFLFDYNENQELTLRPRQCLPYAVVSVFPVSNVTPSAVLSTLAPSIKPHRGIISGSVECLKTCTVAQRWGKGQSATVTFKHFSPQGCPVRDYRPQSIAITTPLQSGDLQNTQYCSSLQQQASPFHALEPCTTSVPNSNQTHIVQNTPSTSQQLHSTSNTKESNISECVPDTKKEMDRVSTIVYSSRFVKDPRLSTREINNPEGKGSKEQQMTDISPNSIVADEQKCHTSFKNLKKESTRAGIEEDAKGFPAKLDRDKRDIPSEYTTKHKKNPSVKSLKMKLQKYAAYFQMTEKERQEKIWSEDSLSTEQKYLLIDRIHFYETYYHRHKQGLLSEKDLEVEITSDLLHKTPEMNANHLSSSLPRTQQETSVENHQHIRQEGFTIDMNMSDFSPRLDVVDGLENTGDVDYIGFERIRCNSPETMVISLKGTEHSSSTHTLINSVKQLDNPLVPTSQVLGISKQCSEHRSLQQGTQEEKQNAVTIMNDFKTSRDVTSPSSQMPVNHCEPKQSESSCKLEIVGECLQTDSASSNAEKDRPDSGIFLIHEGDTEFMNIARCEEISAIGMSSRVETTQNDAQYHDRKTLTDFICDGHSNKLNGLQLKDTIYNKLYNRIQVDQLLPNSNGVRFVSNKSYLKPKLVDKSLDSYSLSGNPDQTNKTEDHITGTQWHNFGEHQVLKVTIKSDRYPVNSTRSGSLSERFSTAKRTHMKFSHHVQEGVGSDNSCTIEPSKDNNCDLPASISSSDVGHDTSYRNLTLIQLLAEKYNKLELFTSQRFCRWKKVSHIPCSRISTHSLRHTLRRVRKLRRELLRRTKKYFKPSFVVKSNCIAKNNKVIEVSTNCQSHTSETDNECNTDQRKHSISNTISPVSEPYRKIQLSNVENNEMIVCHSVAVQRAFSCPNSCANYNHQRCHMEQEKSTSQDNDLQTKAYTPISSEDVKSELTSRPTDDDVPVNQRVDYFTGPLMSTLCNSTLNNVLNNVNRNTSKEQVEIPQDFPASVIKTAKEAEKNNAMSIFDEGSCPNTSQNTCDPEHHERDTSVEKASEAKSCPQKSVEEVQNNIPKSQTGYNILIHENMDYSNEPLSRFPCDRTTENAVSSSVSKDQVDVELVWKSKTKKSETETEKTEIQSICALEKSCERTRVSSDDLSCDSGSKNTEHEENALQEEAQQAKTYLPKTLQKVNSELISTPSDSLPVDLSTDYCTEPVSSTLCNSTLNNVIKEIKSKEQVEICQDIPASVITGRKEVEKNIVRTTGDQKASHINANEKNCDPEHEEGNTVERTLEASPWPLKSKEEVQSDNSKCQKGNNILLHETMDYSDETASKFPCDSASENVISSVITKPQVEMEFGGQSQYNICEVKKPRNHSNSESDEFCSNPCVSSNDAIHSCVPTNTENLQEDVIQEMEMHSHSQKVLKVSEGDEAPVPIQDSNLIHENTKDPAASVLTILSEPHLGDAVLSDSTTSPQVKMTLDPKNPENNSDKSKAEKTGGRSYTDDDTVYPNICVQAADTYKQRHQERTVSQEMTLDACQYTLKALEVKRDIPESLISSKTMNGLTEPVSAVICNNIIPCMISSKKTKPQVEKTGRLPSSACKDKMAARTITPQDTSHSSFQREKNANGIKSQETQLIVKLRNYLTKFESTVKRQEMTEPSEENNLPVAWIALDSTVHKQQLFGLGPSKKMILPYLKAPDSSLPTSSNSFDNVQTFTIREEDIEKACRQLSEADHTMELSKQRVNKRRQGQKSRVLKRKKKNTVAQVSPDSTSMLGTATDDSALHVIQSNNGKNVAGQMDIPRNTPDVYQLRQNHENAVHHRHTVCTDKYIYSQQHCEIPCKIKEDTTYFHREYSITDISCILKEADHSVSLAELWRLKSKSKDMLQHFISNFERDQNVAFSESIISRDLIIEKYLRHPPTPLPLKFEALNSFLELQMVFEACQFVENKINFLTGQPTFRSLLWYDPTLFGELYKCEIGFQQQSSLFTAFQESLAKDGYSKLQEYHFAVSTLHQQLQGTPDASYYMYLKSKRERLETEAALRNHSDLKSFFLSVPLSSAINFGDSLESLEKLHTMVMAFAEMPEQLPGIFDIGKAEHLSMMCRYLYEKTNVLRSGKRMDNKISWFGLEHLRYDASKILMWRDTEHGNSNSQIVYGITESGISLVNRPSQFLLGTGISTLQQENAPQKHKDQLEASSRQIKHHVQNKSTGNDHLKKVNRSTKRRSTHPPLKYNMGHGGVDQPHISQKNKAAHYQQSSCHTSIHKGTAVNWRRASYDNHSQDLNAVEFGCNFAPHPHSKLRALLQSNKGMSLQQSQLKSTSVTDNERARIAGQQQWYPPMNHQVTLSYEPQILHPWATGGIQHQSTNSAPIFPEVSEEQAYLSSISQTPAPPLFSLQPFSNTTNHVYPLTETTPINYPYFLLNGRTYSTGGPSVSTLQTETAYCSHIL